MDPEIKRQLEEIHALAKDNHQMLRAIRRHQWYGVISTVIFWAVLLVAPLYLYQQYLQPIVDKFSVSAGVPATGPFGLPTFAELQKLLNPFQSK
ncbi:MAG TPA: hypothetical protein PLW99_02750 [Candidatus Paceibacterota bacterium]|nr:MAG: hypothetical protein B7X03_02440 [Parcubacteria group bacterium 21-58-10]HQT83041.1 hypothetical protein [Candidatus Paceibacterota bacterium]